jgi:ComF family protein
MACHQRIDGQAIKTTDRPMSKLSEYNRLSPDVNCSAAPKVNKSGCYKEWLFPTLCALCGGPGQHGRELCSGCEADLPVIEVACYRCGAPLSLPGLCGRCQRQLPAFTRTVACFHYLPPLDALLKRLKFRDELRLARLLGELMADRLVLPHNLVPDVIVPVPLHRRRLRERGFNQALELARPIAERLSVPLNRLQVTRTRDTEPQSELPARLRSRNLKDAFTVAAEFNARHVAIVDDVMTTAHTVNELALALRRKGVVDISVWICARAVFGG